MRQICHKYDAYYETETGEWLEKSCGDAECEFCSARPLTHPEDCTCEVETEPLTKK